MTADAGRYVSLFPSERLLDGFMGQPPFKGCSISTSIIVTGHGTLGQSQTRPNGRPYDRGDFTNQLKIGMRAFTRVADSNGIPDRDDAIRIHRAMFPALNRDLIPLVSRDFDEVVEALKEDWAISLALFLPAMPAGLAITRYTRAPHQAPYVGVKNGRSMSQDPMHPAAPLTWGGMAVPLGQMEKAAKSFPGSDHGLVLAWKVPIGGWTQAAIQNEGIRDRLRELRESVESLTQQVENKQATVVELRAKVAELEAAGTDCAPLISNARAAEHERTLNKAIAALEAQRAD